MMFKIHHVSTIKSHRKDEFKMIHSLLYSGKMLYIHFIEEKIAFLVASF
jgi:hypothetical protein